MMSTCAAERTLTPTRETGAPTPVPLMSSPLSVTLSVAAAFTTIAFVLATRTPPSVYWHLIVSDLVMVTPPKPPGSMQLISPPAAVFEMAPANVLHGAVRLHGLASSPTPETQVRVACAWASELKANSRTNAATKLIENLFSFVMESVSFLTQTDPLTLRLYRGSVTSARPIVGTPIGA